jgi:hypothetical protein
MLKIIFCMEECMTLLKKALVIVFMLSCFGCAVAKEVSSPEAGKVAVCHKGKKTIYVDESAVKAHLGHGDYMGPGR